MSVKLVFDKLNARILEFERNLYYYKYRQIVSPIYITPAQENGTKPPSLRNKQRWDVFSVGATWPEFRSYFWLRFSCKIPESFAGEPVDLRIQLSDQYSLHTPEGIVFVNGDFQHGIDRNHHHIRLTKKASANQAFDIYIKVYTGEAVKYFKRDQVPPYQLVDCSWVVPDKKALNFYYRAKALFEVLQLIPDHYSYYHHWLAILDESFNHIDYTYPRSNDFYQSIYKADRYLSQSLKAEVGTFPETVICIGHAHIDLAWLWTLNRTEEKAIHTFSTVLELMKRNTEFYFFQSQPYLYSLIKKNNPELFKQIQQRIKEGRWEADGGMWVESDCNLPSGESLVRQFLYGCQYFENELNTQCSTLWLPDAFGFNAALPQIMKKAEISYFMTTKLSWNQYNHIPFDSFRWRGLDGSEVLAHFITTPTDQCYETYNGVLNPKEVKGCWDSYSQKEVNNEVLLAFGYGDGGGGPTEEMVLYAQHMQNLPLFPQVKHDRVDAFFYRLNQQRDRLPVWHGELYLEYHRGTYTSQAKTKKLNRQTEFLLQSVEFLTSIAALDGYAYPHDELVVYWQLLLLNQFHDILPGSSIYEVYQDSEQQFKRIKDGAKQLMKQVKDSLCVRERQSFTLVNRLSWKRLEPIFIPCDQDLAHALSERAQMVLNMNGSVNLLLDQIELPPVSFCNPLDQLLDHTPHSTLKATKRGLENRFFRIRFNANGEIVTLYDKEFNREVMADRQKANVFQAFEDKPIAHDAWDIDIFYQDKLLSTGEKADITILEEGPIRASLRINKKILDGEIEQIVSVYRESRRIDFDTKVYWTNKDVLLKVAFPVDIHAHQASYDIPFGVLERPTHWNTSWDWARFEVCAHKWVDLSEGDYGVSLFNNCKYGHDIKDNVIRLTLIKCAGAPDPMADVGVHYFKYGLYPHAGGWREAKIPQRAYEFNVDPQLLTGEFNHSMIKANQPIVMIDRDHVLLDTIKWAEKENAMIIRLYECYNQRGYVTLQLAVSPKSVTECNLLEREDHEVDWQDNKIKFFIKPFEIRTFKVFF